jgi:hypothetical protein
VYGTGLARVSGDSADGVYEGSFTVPRGAGPGAWPLNVQGSDRTNNRFSVDAAALEARGLPGHVQVTSPDADRTPPVLEALQVLTPQVDVRQGPATATVRLRITDAGSGVRHVVVFPIGPHPQGGGGVSPPFVRLMEGTTADGWWTGDLPVEQYAHAGSWSLLVRIRDDRDNGVELSSADLRSRGLDAGFSVLSEEDVTAPRITRARLSAVEVDVSKADQTVVFDATATDDRSGVLDHDWGASDLQLSLQHPLGSRPVSAACSGSRAPRSPVTTARASASPGRAPPDCGPRRSTPPIASATAGRTPAPCSPRSACRRRCWSTTRRCRRWTSTCCLRTAPRL